MNEIAVDILSTLLVAVMFVEGIALSVGARWAFLIGIPLRRRTETLDVALPADVVDLADPLDRRGYFDLPDYRTAHWLDGSRIGLLYWAVAFGARNILRIRGLRGLGGVATGLVQVSRSGGRTVFSWRPMLRLSPLCFIAGLAAIWRLYFGPDFPILEGVAILGSLYAGLLWWTLRQLPGIYESVTAQLVSVATRGHA